MTVAQILDQVRELDSGELLVLRRVLDELVDTSLRSQDTQRPFRTVPVDMGSPLVDINKALDIASSLDDQRTLELMGRVT